MEETQIITGDMLIGDILYDYPEAAQIMEDFGLHCTACSVNAVESLYAGAMGHGMKEDQIDTLISKLNDLARGKKNKADPKSIFMTARAALKVKEFAKVEDKEGWLLRITTHKQECGKEPAYSMDFIKKADKKDKCFEFEGVKIVLNPKDFECLKGSDIDYLQTKFGEGFKITNPNFKKEACCGGESCKS